jgi:PAS domain S-box-containing protein
MKNQNDPGSAFAQLRQQAEMQLQPTVPISQLSEGEIQKLIHDIDMQQLELEKQLRELAIARKRLTESTAPNDVADDNTEHKQAEKLPESEIRFRKLLQDVQSVSVQGYASDGTTQYWNQASERLYGYTAEEAIGKNLVDLIIPPEMRSDVQQAILQMAETGQPIPSSELSLMHKDGSRVSVFSSHTIVQVPGHAPELFCIDIDLTERKKAEQTLFESEKRYRTLFESSLTGILITRPDGAILAANPEACRLLGRTETDICQIGRDGVVDLTNPNLRIALEKRQQTGHFHGELTYVRADGTVFPIEIESGIYTDSDGQTYAYNFFQDITERKKTEKALIESELRYRLLAENITDVIWVQDIETNSFNYVSPSYEQMFGYSVSRFMKYGIRETLTAESLQYLRSVIPGRLERFRNGLREVFTDEIKHIHQNGNLIDIEIKSRLMVNPASGHLEVTGVVRDITKRKQADDARRESETNIQAIFNATNDSIFLIAADETLLTMNEIAAQRIGQPEEKLIGKKIYDLLPAEVVRSRRPFFNQAMQTGKIVKFEDERNGYSLSTSLYPILDVEGNVIRLAVYSSDITERKRAEEAQRQSQVFLNSIIENSPNMLWISDENGTLIRMNQACRDHLQIQDKEVVGIYNILNDNLIKEQGLMPLVKDVFEKGATVRFETSYDTAVIKSIKLEKTTQIFLDINISPILNDQGKIIHAIIQEIDITDRKLAEEELLNRKRQYDNLASKIPVGVYILHTKADGSFALDYVSLRMAEMLGLSVDSLLADNNIIFSAIHPDDVEGFRTLSRDGIFQHRPFNWKGRIVADGNIKWMHFRSTPELLENGDTLWHGLIVDITERVNAEQVISLKSEELSNLLAEKDKFISVLAHDLRSPFNSILGFTQMLDDDLPTMEFDQIKRIASVLRNSAFSAYILLENLLEWSRMKRGITNFNPEAFKLRSKIEESLQSVKELATKKWIEVSINVPEDLQVLADQNMLGSIIRNLTTNAIKFTPKYGTVLLSARIDDDQNIEISVKDTGIGMNQNILNRLFSNDERTNRKGTDGESSSGLGLIICKEFVEKHGGRIWAKSEVGKGSTFYFMLPNT